MANWDNAFLIFNPKAGQLNRKRDQLLQRTIEKLTFCGHRVTAVPTTGPATAAAIARDCIAKGADLIIAAGGDGTINEVANGMIYGEVPLAILPAGTANVLSVELGLGTRIVRAAERLSELVPEKIAVGLLENSMERRHFLMMAGVGFDAMIVYNIDVALKQRIGRVAYWIAGFSQFGRALPEFDVRANGHVSRCSFALASRVRNYGGDLYIARGASLFSDQFELITFEGAHSVPYVKYLLGVITGRLASMKGVTVLRTESLEVEAPSESSIYIQTDGEYAGRLPARISIVPRGITLLMPPDFRMKHTRQSNG